MINIPELIPEKTVHELPIVLLNIVYSNKIQDVFSHMKVPAVNGWKLNHNKKLDAWIVAELQKLPFGTYPGDLTNLEMKSWFGVLPITTGVVFIGVQGDEREYLTYTALVRHRREPYTVFQGQRKA